MRPLTVAGDLMASTRKPQKPAARKPAKPVVKTAAAKPVAKAAKPVTTKPVAAAKPTKAPVAVAKPAAKVVAAAKPAAAAADVAALAKVVAAQPPAAPGKPGRKRRGENGADTEALSTIERRAPVMPEERQSQLKLLIALGKEQSFLTYSQVNDHLPSEIVDPEQIEDIVNMINDMGIPVYEKAPDSEPLLATENSQPADEEAIEEAAAALAALDAELGRTTDPVRMYMREMGTVELLTREGEISIAKRIEEGLDAVRRALALYPATIEHLLKAYEPVKTGGARLVDIIVGFIDPNAPDVIAQPQNPTKMD